MRSSFALKTAGETWTLEIHDVPGFRRIVIETSPIEKSSIECFLHDGSDTKKASDPLSGIANRLTRRLVARMQSDATRSEPVFVHGNADAGEELMDRCAVRTFHPPARAAAIPRVLRRFPRRLRNPHFMRGHKRMK